MTPADPDMLAMPDPDSRDSAAVEARRSPGSPAICIMDGKPVEQAPRQVLKRLIARRPKRGYRAEDRRRVRVLPDHARRHGDLRRRRHAGQALLRPAGADAPLRRDRRDLRRHARARLGPYQNDHEDANGQFEMNWDYDDALATADRHAFFKYMVKSIAEKHGLRATFMPKPFATSDRQRLPRARVAVGQRRQETVRRSGRRARPVARWPTNSSAA